MPTRSGSPWADHHGFNLTRLRQAVFANEAAPYVPVRADEVELLGPPFEVARFQLGASATSRFTRDVVTHCSDAGLCDGWLGMFSATLAPGRGVLSFTCSTG